MRSRLTVCLWVCLFLISLCNRTSRRCVKLSVEKTDPWKTETATLLTHLAKNFQPSISAIVARFFGHLVPAPCPEPRAPSFRQVPRPHKATHDQTLPMNTRPDTVKKTRRVVQSTRAWGDQVKRVQVKATQSQCRLQNQYNQHTQPWPVEDHSAHVWASLAAQLRDINCSLCLSSVVSKTTS